MPFQMILPQLPESVGLIAVTRDELSDAFDAYVATLCQRFMVWTNTGHGPAPQGAEPGMVRFGDEELVKLATSVADFLRSPDPQLWVAEVAHDGVVTRPLAWAMLGRDFALTRNGAPDGPNFGDGPEWISSRLVSWAYAQGEQHVRATMRPDGVCVGEVIT